MKKIVLTLLLALGCITISNGMDTVRVNTPTQLIDSIQSDRLILLTPGEYSMENAQQLEELLAKTNIQRQVIGEWLMYSSGQGLILNQVKNLIIRGEGEEPVKIVTPQKADNVITMLGCVNVALEHLTLGHMTSSEDVEPGAILSLIQCEKIMIENCELAGSYGVGFVSSRSKVITINKSSINGCLDGAVDLKNSWTVKLLATSIYNNKACKVFVNAYRCTDMQMKQCEMYDNIGKSGSRCAGSKLMNLAYCELVQLNANTIKGNTCVYLGNSEAVRLLNSQNTIKRNKFESMAPSPAK